MDMKELIKKAKESAEIRTPEERFQLLVKAKILTPEGHYDPRFFSEKTGRKSKEKNKIK